MRWLSDQRPPYDLAYSDAFLVPSMSAVDSRLSVDLTPPDGLGTTVPVVVSNMTAVTGRRMAETIARRGGLGILPQDISAEAVGDMVAAVKAADPFVDTPITLSPTDTITTALDLILKRSHRAVIVIDHERRPVGVFTEADAVGMDRFAPISEVMSPSPISLREGFDAEQAHGRLQERRLHLAPVVDEEGRLVGIVTDEGALRSTIYDPALDGSGRLMVGAAIGVNGDVATRTKTLLESEVDVIVVDTAHGHQQKMLDALAAVRSVAPQHPVVAGNVVTAEGTRALLDAGADVVKVGVGPGAMCTTRMMTAVGRPQLSAVIDCAVAARDAGKHVWADGGVRHPRDVALAVAAGASSVMVGTWFAATFESAADAVREQDGRIYKENYGMASARAVTSRSGDESAFQRARKEMFDEGISSSRLYLDPSAPSVEQLLDRITAGLRSACTYAGAADLTEFAERAVIGVQSPAGFAEGMPRPGGG
jgi:IMP dehydrogenase